MGKRKTIAFKITSHRGGVPRIEKYPEGILYYLHESEPGDVITIEVIENNDDVYDDISYDYRYQKN